MFNFEKIKLLLDEAQAVVILIHQDPDGDAIGAGAAIYFALQADGKRVLLPRYGVIRETAFSLNPQEILSDGWPDTFQPDLVLILDSADLSQLGDIASEQLQSLTGIPWINIDHHVSNVKFADVNYVDSTASSTCEIIAHYLLTFGYDISPRMAGFLLGGLVSDTGRFAYKNTTSRTLETAAVLVSHGANLAQIVEDLESRISLHGIQLWGSALGGVKSAFANQVVWTAVPYADFQETEDAALIMRELIAFLRRGKGVELAILFKESEPGLVNISFRSYGRINCALIAQKFGGGGHNGAAGGRYRGTVPEAEKAVLAFLEHNNVGLR